MSRSVTPSTALFAPVTGQDAAHERALGHQAQVLPDAPIGTEKRTGGVVMVATPDTKDNRIAESYFAQVYAGTKDDLTFAHSFAQFVAFLEGFSSIDRLVLLSHATHSDVKIGERLMDVFQLVEALKDVAVPTISTLTFDGCAVGANAEGLYAMKSALPISKIEGWTYWHHLQLWGRTDPPADPTENLSAVLDFAAPYVPTGPGFGPGAGAMTSGQLQGQLDASKKFEVVTEFFSSNIDSHIRFETMTAPVAHAAPGDPVLLGEGWNKARYNSDAQFPRSAVRASMVDSNPAAVAQGQVVRANEAPPYRVVVS